MQQDADMHKTANANANSFPKTNETSLDALQAYVTWEGREEVAHDVASAATVAMLHAMLDRAGPSPAEGDPLPPGWHWAFFAPRAPQSQLDEDGHPQRGAFLPPVPLPRRMWAGGRLRWHAPLKVGDALHRASRILAVRPKEGHSGQMVFVTVLHEIHGPQGLVITEEQDIVYRHAVVASTTKGPNATRQPPGFEPAWRRTVVPSPALLFRYSALTFNAHRIHYDRPFACDVEGYPGLVVHGPLQATLLLDLAIRHAPERLPQGFSFSARAPLFDGEVFAVCGTPEGESHAVLWTEDHRGATAMRADIHWV